jgi:hypothetical protein
LTVIDANAAYLRASGRTREQIVGRYLFDAFPTRPFGIRTFHTGLLPGTGAGQQRSLKEQIVGT